MKRIQQFFSKAINRSIALDSVKEIADDDLIDVWAEVSAELSDLNMKIRSSGSKARSTGRFLPSEEWSAMLSRKATLGAIHQAIQVRRSKLAKREKQSADTPLSGCVPPIEIFFQAVARNELDPVTYQRLILQAELRRSVAAQAAFAKSTVQL